MEKMTLAYKPNNTITFDGRRYSLRLSFDAVLRVLDLQRDTLFLPHERLALSVKILAGAWAVKLPVEKQSELFSQIFDEYINDSGRPVRSGPRVLDFTQDAETIYASFRQAYGIDLYEEQGRMDWRIFMALFQGLPENTKIREIMSIRGREIPAATKYNAKEIAALMEAKAYYAIRVSEDEAEQTFQSGVDRLAASLTERGSHGIL